MSPLHHYSGLSCRASDYPAKMFMYNMVVISIIFSLLGLLRGIPLPVSLITLVRRSDTGYKLKS